MVFFVGVSYIDTSHKSQIIIFLDIFDRGRYLEPWLHLCWNVNKEAPISWRQWDWSGKIIVGLWRCILCQIFYVRIIYRSTHNLFFWQLFRIFRLLGTPNETIWPGVTHLQDFNSSFPNWDAPTEFANILPDLKVIFVERIVVNINI